MAPCAALALAGLLALSAVVEARLFSGITRNLGTEQYLSLPGALRSGREHLSFDGTKWAILIAGSAGYANYRHQADVCHAYQLLVRNGLKEENIVVFMYDDIAHNPENPHPGTLINQPQGADVYAGVPKDYTGSNVTVGNFLAALRGDRSAVRGGSGKVVTSGPRDHVFVFFSDHGGPGILGMPTLPYLFADDVVDTLKAKHAAKGFKELVFYLEACESGSIFEGLLPDDIHVYATTASNAMESSWGTYCPGMYPEPPSEYETCLGDLYSVAWMEDSDMHNLNRETLKLQYELVKDRTSNHQTYESGSHVMQYGAVAIDVEPVSLFTGSDPAKEGGAAARAGPAHGYGGGHLPDTAPGRKQGVNQRDADMLHLWHKYKNAAEGSPRKAAALEEMSRAAAERAEIDRAVGLLARLLGGHAALADAAPREPGQPLVDDWQCLRNMIRAFEAKCGRLTQYGMKHTRTFANACNAGIAVGAVASAAADACSQSTRHLAVNGVFSA